jgi:hypothetical protein
MTGGVETGFLHKRVQPHLVVTEFMQKNVPRTMLVDSSLVEISTNGYGG